MTQKKEPVFQVHCGDAHHYFGYGRLYRQSHMRRIFTERVERIRVEFFPGLVLKDGQGNLWKPELHVELVPVGEPCPA